MIESRHESGTSRLRPILIALILVLGAYWVGARYGPHQAKEVEARHLAVPVPEPAAAPAGVPANVVEHPGNLTEDESINVRIYREASPAVANILTKATEYNFFMDPIPVEGAGSGFLIDPRGYILTNFHVVAGAQTIEVILGDKSRYPAKFVGADQRNDVALVKDRSQGKATRCLDARRLFHAAGRSESSRHRQSLRFSVHAHDRSRQRTRTHRANKRDYIH